MNYRLITDAEKAASKRRRNLRKSAKRFLKRHAVMENGASLLCEPSAVGCIGGLKLEEQSMLFWGSLRQQKAMMERLNARIREACSTSRSDPKPVARDSDEPKPMLKPQTHEFVQKGDNGGRRKREVFQLW